MSDVDPTTFLRERYEALATRRLQLRAELDPLELEMAKLQAGLVAMGATEGLEQVVPWAPAPAHYLHLVQEAVASVALDGETQSLHPRQRHPDLQAAIDDQTPTVAITPGTKLYCRDGCTNGDAGGFGDQMALRTHTKRRHDREPTEQEKVPR